MCVCLGFVCWGRGAGCVVCVPKMLTQVWMHAKWNTLKHWPHDQTGASAITCDI